MASASVRFAVSVIATSALFFLSGCNVNPSREAVIGRYVLSGKGADRIVLTLADDGSFTEKIMTSQILQPLVGRWSLRDGNIDFVGLWIPPAFAPEDVVEQDRRAEAGHVKYTEPGHWDLSVEKLWGRMRIEVFPDEEIEFVQLTY